MSPRAKRYTLLGSDRPPSGPSRVAGTAGIAGFSPTSRPPSRPGTGPAPRACPTPTPDGRHDVVERGHFTSVFAFHFTSAGAASSRIFLPARPATAGANPPWPG